MTFTVLNALISSGSKRDKAKRSSWERWSDLTQDLNVWHQRSRFEGSYNTRREWAEDLRRWDKSLRCCGRSKKVRASSRVDMPFYWRRDEGQSGKRRTQTRLRSWSFWATLSSSDSMAARLSISASWWQRRDKSGHWWILKGFMNIYIHTLPFKRFGVGTFFFLYSPAAFIW